ncbi:MAG TPA: hypothetical protein VIS78_08585, partial [Blastocatellia bacterium]
MGRRGDGAMGRWGDGRKTTRGRGDTATRRRKDGNEIRHCSVAPSPHRPIAASHLEAQLQAELCLARVAEARTH